MKQQQHDINLRRCDRDLVGCSNHLSYWRLYGEQGPTNWPLLTIESPVAQVVRASD